MMSETQKQAEYIERILEPTRGQGPTPNDLETIRSAARRSGGQAEARLLVVVRTEDGALVMRRRWLPVVGWRRDGLMDVAIGSATVQVCDAADALGLRVEGVAEGGGRLMVSWSRGQIEQAGRAA